MNSKELGIYTALTHPTSPEHYRIEDDGTKLYVISHGALIYLEGEKLDEMDPQELYRFYQEKLYEYLQMTY